MQVRSALCLLAVFALATVGICGPCPKNLHSTQQELDECYMRVALNYGIYGKPSKPFGAIIVDTNSNEIKCYGYNNASKSVILHGEIAAITNCSELYPSPTGNDQTNPGLHYSNMTLYTTAEPTPLGMEAVIIRGFGRIVTGTDIPTLAKIGLRQTFVRNRELLKASIAYMPVPRLKEHVLKEDCDRAFYTGAGLPYPIPQPSDSTEDVFW